MAGVEVTPMVVVNPPLQFLPLLTGTRMLLTVMEVVMEELDRELNSAPFRTPARVRLLGTWLIRTPVKLTSPRVTLLAPTRIL